MIKCFNSEIEDLLFLNLAQNKAKLTAKNVQHGQICFLSCFGTLFILLLSVLLLYSLADWDPRTAFFMVKMLYCLLPPLLQPDNISTKSLIRMLVAKCFIKVWVLIIFLHIPVPKTFNVLFPRISKISP